MWHFSLVTKRNVSTIGHLISELEKEAYDVRVALPSIREWLSLLYRPLFTISFAKDIYLISTLLSTNFSCQLFCDLHISKTKTKLVHYYVTNYQRWALNMADHYHVKQFTLLSVKIFEWHYLCYCFKFWIKTTKAKGTRTPLYYSVVGK